MEYTKYNKTMVLLSEENRDFAAKSEQAIYGNLRIETGNNKGAISLSVQNLRFYERNRYIYKLILFGEKKERTIHAVMGSLILNRFGTSENYFRFDPINVDGKGGKLEDYSVAIIAAVSMKDNREPLHPVLKGKLIFAGSNVMAAGKDKTMDTTGDNNFQNSRAERNTEDRGNSQAEYRESSQAEYRDNSQAESRQFDNRKIGDRNLGNRQDERNTVPAEKRNQNNNYEG